MNCGRGSSLSLSLSLSLPSLKKALTIHPASSCLQGWGGCGCCWVALFQACIAGCSHLQSTLRAVARRRGACALSAVVSLGRGGSGWGVWGGLVTWQPYIRKLVRTSWVSRSSGLPMALSNLLAINETLTS